MYERDVVKLTIKRWRETENIVYFCLHIRFLFIEWQKNSIIKQNVVIDDVTKTSLEFAGLFFFNKQVYRIHILWRLKATLKRLFTVFDLAFDP